MQNYRINFKSLTLFSSFLFGGHFSFAEDGSRACFLTDHCYFIHSVPDTKAYWNKFFYTKGQEIRHPQGKGAEFRASSLEDGAVEAQTATGCFIAAIERSTTLKKILDNEYDSSLSDAVACVPYVDWEYKMPKKQLWGMVTPETREVLKALIGNISVGAINHSIEGDQRYAESSYGLDTWYKPLVEEEANQSQIQSFLERSEKKK